MILENVFWSFGDRYETYEEFVEKVTEYNKAISDKNKWNPEQVIVENDKAIVYYEAMWKDEDDELEVTITAKGSAGIKMGELLYAINNASVDFFEGADAIFFEGLLEVGEDDNLPEFEMLIGS